MIMPARELGRLVEIVLPTEARLLRTLKAISADSLLVGSFAALIWPPCLARKLLGGRWRAQAFWVGHLPRVLLTWGRWWAKAFWVGHLPRVHLAWGRWWAKAFWVGHLPRVFLAWSTRRRVAALSEPRRGPRVNEFCRGR